MSALLHFDGTDGSTSFIDEKGHAFSLVAGSPQLDADQKKFGASSLLLPATTAAVNTGASSDHNLSGAWTVEFWLRVASLPGAAREIITIGDNPDGGNSANTLWIYLTSVNTLSVYNGNLSFNSSFTPSLDVWHHIACTRVGAAGTTVRLFADGVVIGSSSSTGRSSSSNQIRIGRSSGIAGSALPCWIDDFRLTSGVARYTGNFDPPDSPFPNS